MISKNTGPLRTLLVTYHNTLIQSVIMQGQIHSVKKSILYCSTFLAPMQVWHIFQCCIHVNFLYSSLADSEAPVRIYFSYFCAMKSGSILENIFSNIFINPTLVPWKSHVNSTMGSYWPHCKIQNKNTVYYYVFFLQIIFYNTGLYSYIDKQTWLCLRDFRMYKRR
jgi:hypothetical protein